MPGFSLLYDTSELRGGARRVFAAALSLASHTGTYSQQVFDLGTHGLLGWSTYPEYPRKSLELTEAILLLDGIVYHPSDAALFELARKIDSEPDACARMANWLRQWLTHCDAECVIVYVRRRPGEGVLIANDVLGRLPVYWTEENGRLLAAREIKMMVPQLQAINPDRQGIAETLHLGFPLGARTLLDRVARLGPASILRTGMGNSAAQCLPYHEWSFDDADESKAPASGEVERLAESFTEGCRRRATALSGRKLLLLLLSGGLDSRATAGGLADSGNDFCALTYSEARHHTAEGRIAAQVATLLGHPHDTVDLRVPPPWDRQWIIELRDGLNYAAVAGLRQVYSHVCSVHGNDTVIFSGEGGDKVMPRLRPGHDITTLEHLAAMIVGQALMLPLGTVCRLTGLSRQEIVAGIRRTLGEYPERELADRYVHFHIFERGYKWLFEGEERARSQLWCTTPFYAMPFFDQAMRIPQRWKKSKRWYCDFLRAFSPGLADIPNSNTGKLPGSRSESREEMIKQVLGRFPRLDSIVRRTNRRRQSGATHQSDVWLPSPMLAVEESSCMNAALNGQVVREVLGQPMNPGEYWQLVTVLWYLHTADSTRWFGREC